jgi:hypothetical protein
MAVFTPSNVDPDGGGIYTIQDALDAVEFTVKQVSKQFLQK